MSSAHLPMLAAIGSGPTSFPRTRELVRCAEILAAAGMITYDLSESELTARRTSKGTKHIANGRNTMLAKHVLTSFEAGVREAIAGAYVPTWEQVAAGWEPTREGGLWVRAGLLFARNGGLEGEYTATVVDFYAARELVNHNVRRVRGAR